MTIPAIPAYPVMGRKAVALREGRALRVLVACEFSGIVRDSFARLGHDAWSCDVLPTERPGNHFQCDVRDVLDRGWDLMIAHPPCRFLSYAGMANWNDRGRREKREAAMRFFIELANAPIERIAIENPRGLPCQEYRKPEQVIHPWFFGDPAMKRTCLWLKNLPSLWWWEHENSLFPRTATDRPNPISIDNTKRKKKRYWTDASTRDPHERSRTFPAIGEAMAEQWSHYILEVAT